MKAISMKAILLLALAVLGALGFACADPASAQPTNEAAAYPDRPVRILVPFAAGGVSDVLVRAVGKRLSDKWDQPVIIDNRPGANTQIAAVAAAKSPADGYTLLLASDPTMSINPVLYRKLQYDPAADFAPVTPLVRFSQVLVTTPSVTANTLKEFVAYAKANPGKLNYASFGIGSQPHLVTESFKSLTKIGAVHVPYKGVAPAVTDMLGGQIQMMFASVATPRAHVQSGMLKVLGVAGPHRSELLPGVPTFAEAGFGEFESIGWFGIFAPAGTPVPILDKLASEITTIVRSPEFGTQVLRDAGLDAAGGTRAEFAAFLKADSAKWSKIVTDSGVKLD